MSQTIVIPGDLPPLPEGFQAERYFEERLEVIFPSDRCEEMFQFCHGPDYRVAVSGPLRTGETSFDAARQRWVVYRVVGPTDNFPAGT